MIHTGGYLKGLIFYDKGILYDSVLMQTDENTFNKGFINEKIFKLEKNERILGFKAIN